jgi:hypothetical protein
MPRNSRDDFSEATRHHLARSVNYHCSKCGAPTAAPYTGGGKSITTGVAAHICAAAPGGPRFDPNMTSSQRRHYDNGIWLCAAHAPLVDQDWPAYTVDELKAMKQRAEAKAASDLEHAKEQARLEPVLDGQIEWHAPAVNETRPGFQRLHHAVFRIGGTRKQRSYLQGHSEISRASSRHACARIVDQKHCRSRTRFSPSTSTWAEPLVPGSHLEAPRLAEVGPLCGRLA